MEQLEAKQRNSAFYTRFRYPWRPRVLTVPEDPDHAIRFLNQALGAWHGERLPRDMNIWVAGCGTNQAVMLALAFPQAAITATDISPGSLENSRSLANEMKLERIEFRCEPVDAMSASEHFHFIVCTGVVHHNPDPKLLLQTLARALRSDGVLELMVYNLYHRTETMAFQQAVRTIAGDAVASSDFERQMYLTRNLIENLPSGRMRESLDALRSVPEEMIADALLQPIEQAYTVETLDALLRGCGLRLAIPSPNQFDIIEQRPGWEMQFADRELERRYYELSDIQRWTVTNHLLLGRSPMLWFYVDRLDSPSPLPCVRVLAESFAKNRYQRVRSAANVYVADEFGRLRRYENQVPLPCPTVPADKELRAIWDVSEPTIPLGETLESRKYTGLATLNRLREGLTTLTGSYLRTV